LRVYIVTKINLAVLSNYVRINSIRIWYKAEQGVKKMREPGGQNVASILIRYL